MTTLRFGLTLAFVYLAALVLLGLVLRLHYASIYGGANVMVVLVAINLYDRERRKRT